MKTKFLFCCIVLTSIVSCNNALHAPDMPTNFGEEKESRTYQANEEEAISSATHFFEGMKDKSRSQTSFKELMSISRINSNSSRSEDGSCGFYLLNFEGGGFALTSADQRDSAKVYLASSDLNINEDFLRTDDFMSYIISIIENYQDSIIGTYNPNTLLSRSNDPVDRGGSLVETITVNYDIGPLLPTAWSQGSPFNATIAYPYFVIDDDYNPAIGCVPVAVGQIMAFHEKPNKLHGTPLIWKKLKSVTVNTPFDTAEAKDVSLMLKYVGEDLGIDYSTKNRSVLSDNVYDVLKSYGYTLDQYSDFYYQSVLKSVRNNRPVYMRGWDKNKEAGHAWVVDGAYSYTVETLAYDKDGNHIPNDYVFDYNTIYTYSYIHVNPGWGPGYLYSGLLSTYYDPMISGLSPTVHVNSSIFNMDIYKFNSNLKTYCNIQ